MSGGGTAALLGLRSSLRIEDGRLVFFTIKLLSPVPAVTVVVDPPVVDPVEVVAGAAVDHSEPVGVVDVGVRDLAGLSPAAEPCDLERIDRAEIPLADPVADKAGAQPDARGDHPAEVL